MANQFSPIMSDILLFSREEAARLTSRFVGPEHLLLALLRLKEGPVFDAFNSLNIDKKSLKNELESKAKLEVSPQPVLNQDLVMNDKAVNILRLSVLEARMQNTDQVNEQHLLLAILHDKVDNGAKQALAMNNIDYNAVLNYFNSKQPVTNGIGFPDEGDEESENPFADSNSPSSNFDRKKTNSKLRNKEKSKTPILDNFSTDITKAAIDGLLDPVVGREREMQRVLEILGRRRKNNPILIGDPGVGKSAIVEGLAQQIVNHKTPPSFFNKRIVSLNMTAMVAGTKYRGQFEERMQNLVSELEQNSDIIIFIDEIHNLLGAGSAEGTMDAANILKPVLARGTIQCIGATTVAEFRKYIEKDGAMERRFQKVLVEQTTVDETVQILNNLKDRYEEYHSVNYTDEAIMACVKLTERYVSDRFFPDKAIDVLDETGSSRHLSSTHIPPEIVEKNKELEDIMQQKQSAVAQQNFELAASFRDRETELESVIRKLEEVWQAENKKTRVEVTAEDVSNVVSVMSGVPLHRISLNENIRLKGMAADLKSHVVSQDGAIDKLVRSIQRNRIGMKDPNRPIGVFMFLGPTGVGKTYLAKRLAEFMFGSADAMIRLDMSEFQEQYTVSRLIGSTPGYVGYEEGGQLTERVRRNPYSIILLDEIEKAHNNVYNLFLQVFDEGRLTDGMGRLVDFRNTVIIMTSNTGSRQLKEFGHGVGFVANSVGVNMSEKDREYAHGIIQKALSKQFSPEFLNRMDEIVTFDQLDKSAIRKILDLELDSLSKRIADLGYKMEIAEEAKDFITEKGYDVQFGARPLKRAIQNYIEDGISDYIINHEPATGSLIHIGKDEEKEALTFTFSAEG